MIMITIQIIISNNIHNNKQVFIFLSGIFILFLIMLVRVFGLRVTSSSRWYKINIDKKITMIHTMQINT
jgi:hypothetical protein